MRVPPCHLCKHYTSRAGYRMNVGTSVAIERCTLGGNAVIPAIARAEGGRCGGWRFEAKEIPVQQPHVPQAQDEFVSQNGISPDGRFFCFHYSPSYDALYRDANIFVRTRLTQSPNIVMTLFRAAGDCGKYLSALGCDNPIGDHHFVSVWKEWPTKWKSIINLYDAFFPDLKDLR